MSMNLLIWNIHGIGNKPSQRVLKRICKQNKLKIMTIIEPMIALDGLWLDVLVSIMLLLTATIRYG